MIGMPRTIKMTDEDWAKISLLAEAEGTSISKWIWDACSQKANEHGVTLEGLGQHGGLRPQHITNTYASKDKALEYCQSQKVTKASKIFVGHLGTDGYKGGWVLRKFTHVLDAREYADSVSNPFIYAVGHGLI